MVVYVEAVILDNLVVDALLLFLVLKTLGQKINVWGLILACFFGVGFALTSPLLLFDGVLGVLIKIAEAFLMCIMLQFSFKKIFLKTTLLLFYTFAFGGMLLAVLNFLGVTTVDGMYIGYVSEYPIGAMFAIFIAFIILCFWMLKALLKTQKIKKLCMPVMLKINGKTAFLNGFCDSGNLLKTKNGTPVVMLNSFVLKNWFSSEEQIKILLKKPPNNKCLCEIISVQSAVKKENVLVLKAEACVFNNKNFDVFVGVYKMKSSVFDVILNSNMVVENV